MVLHDTSFPSDLADRCKRLTGHASATKAVRSALQSLLQLRERYKQLQTEHGQLKQKFEILFHAVNAKFEADSALSGAIERVSADDFFALERETWDRRKDGE